jgi:TetR/AcrR family transcriptional repressor of mexJK operon
LGTRLSSTVLMKIDDESRSARKEREIIQAATQAFISKGYDGTTVSY